MKDLTIIIPVKDELLPVLERTLAPLLTGIEGRNAEIIIVDNSLYETHTFNHQQIRHLKNGRNVGVGLAFNQGVGAADSERVMLMGCDVIIQDNWYDRVLQTLDDHANTIFCAVSSGYTDQSKPFRPVRVRRFGCHVVYKVTKDDIPIGSKLRNDPKFSRILQGKWNYFEPNPGQELGQIGCLMGALYWMHKSDYTRIHGWNHHRQWGTLEPNLSIRARGHGMQIMLDKTIEGSHYFSREIVRPSRGDFQYFNMLYLAHTCFSPSIAGELEYYLRYGGRDIKVEKLNVNKARVMLKRMSGAVTTERDYNNRHFTHGLIKDINNFEKFEIWQK